MEVTAVGPIAVAGYHYAVTTPTAYLRDLDLWAQQDVEAMEIKVREYLTPAMHATCLLHEIIHAICVGYNGGEQLPETVVESLAQGLYQVIQDNPRLLQFITESQGA